MNYGFVIDNRKCIGCHACTVACKSEHEVAIGVNRTHVKYVEIGEFPQSERLFSVHRCNHCEKPPCVEICPTLALFKRKDGIVDFDNARCIGCKSCMQACPYDALYVDPNTKTAAKCNYCAHRIDHGYEPACVVICPTQAIQSGDFANPESSIAQSVQNHEFIVRKPEKHTIPNVCYIEGKPEMFNPNSDPEKSDYLWSEQTSGVGHYAGNNQAVNDNPEVNLALETDILEQLNLDQKVVKKVKNELRQDKKVNRTYDSPGKGVLWGWQVPTYIWTKAIATGTYFMLYILSMFDLNVPMGLEISALTISIIFTLLTSILLVADLDRYDRFLYVLLRPNWNSWLVKGAYILVGFGGVILLKLADIFWDWGIGNILIYPGMILAFFSAIYTALLLKQALARDFWNSSVAITHMFLHALLAGNLVLMLLTHNDYGSVLRMVSYLTVFNILILIYEAFSHHHSVDSQKVALLMRKGSHSRLFYIGLILGNILPLIMLQLSLNSSIQTAAGIMILAGILITEHVRIRLPQLISLS